MAVRAALDARGLSLRGAMLKTGLDHVTIAKMASGFVPRMETVVRFARGLGLEETEWLRRAGYEPTTPSTADAVRALSHIHPDDPILRGDVTAKGNRGFVTRQELEDARKLIDRLIAEGFFDENEAEQ
jgi:transcriptional regulator with XRE-family HTH domain